MNPRLALAVILAAAALAYLAGRMTGPAVAPPEAPPPRPAPEEPPPRPAAEPAPPEDGDETSPGEEDPADRLVKHIDPIVREPTPPPDAIPDLYVGSLIHTPNGDLKVLGTGTDYRLVRHGSWVTKLDSGQKATEEVYLDGVREGLATAWHESGEVKERGSYVSGKRHGLWQAFDERGNRTSETDYDAGAIRAVRRWAADGSPLTDDVLQARATCDGKYRDLLYRFHVPDDVNNYGELKDYGHYRQTDYQDVKGVPAAYWVYVHPYWFVWREKTE